MRTHPIVGDTRGGGARQKESCSPLLELPIRRSGSCHKGGSLRLARPRPPGGGGQPHMILRFLTGVDEPRAMSPRNGVA